MKIFQIGFNKCGTRYIFKIITELGYKGIYHDYGNLARKIFHNFLNCNRLLNEYDQYSFYGGMENVYMNLYVHMLFYKQLDQQYPGSKFILNTRNMNHWINRRLEERGYMTDYLWSSGISCSQVALLKWKELWKQLHTETIEYFGDRMGKDFIIFDVENDHPKKLYTFLSDKKIVKQHFLDLYTKFFSRFDIQNDDMKDMKNMKDLEQINILENTNVYCMYLDEREKHARETIKKHGFPQCIFYRAVIPNDFCKDDFRMLSTVYLFGPPISDCHLCSHNNWHYTIYQKPTKFCVHFSYLSCMWHSIQQDNPFTLIFEDDIYFDMSSKEFVITCKEFMESDFDVLYLGFGHCKKGDKLQPDKLYPHLVKLPPNQSIICKHAILYKTSYMKDMFWDLLPLIECSDVHFNHVNIERKASVCIPIKPFVFQDRYKFGSHNENGDEHEVPLY